MNVCLGPKSFDAEIAARLAKAANCRSKLSDSRLRHEGEQASRGNIDCAIAYMLGTMRSRAIDASEESRGSRERGTLDPTTPSGIASQLEAAVRHDGRLNLLCCLLDEGPLSPFQIAVRIGESAQAVRYWAKLLDTFDLVEVHDGLDDAEPMYSATLAGQPDWIQDAVRQHRPRAL